MKQISVLITDDQYNQLLKIKDEDELKQAVVIRQSIDMFLEDYKSKKVSRKKQKIIEYVRNNRIDKTHEYYKSYMLFASQNSKYYDKQFADEIELLTDLPPSRKIIGIIGSIIRLLQENDINGGGKVGGKENALTSHGLGINIMNLTNDADNIYIESGDIKYHFDINGNISVEEFVDTIIKSSM